MRLRLTSGEWLTVHAAQVDTNEPARPSLTAVTLIPAQGRDLSQLLGRVHGLSRREGEVADTLLSGLPEKLTARRLSISGHTLSDHLKSIFRKVGVTSRAELIAVLTGHPDTDPGRPAP